MRRPTRIGLWVAAVLLAVAAIYTAIWFVIAGRVEGELGAWAAAQRDNGVELSWKTLRVDGFPFAFRIGLEDAQLHDRRTAIPVEAAAPELTGSAHPWNFWAWHLTAPKGISGTAGASETAAVKLAAKQATGSVALGSNGGAAIWLGLGEPAIDSALHVAAQKADLWVNLPAHPPQTHTDPALGVALDLHQLSVPVVPQPFRNPVEELSFGVTVMGEVPAAPPRQAAASWRDSGGTLELDHFRLRWGTLAINGSGTLALDPDLQPIGGFSGAIEGYQELMEAMVAAGRMRPSDARLARLALTMLAKAGPLGRPEISTSLTIQNGEIYLGPVKLGKMPRIAWE